MLNGTAVSSIEFLFAGAAGAAIAAVALWHRHWWWATALRGTAVNCLVVASFALRMRRRGERGGQIRDLLARTHPHLLSDTLVLVSSTLIPMALTTAVALESSRRSHSTSMP